MIFKMFGVENTEIALTILAIIILEESSLHKQTILSKEFLKGKNVDENFIEGCKDKLRKKLQSWKRQSRDTKKSN